MPAKSIADCGISKYKKCHAFSLYKLIKHVYNILTVKTRECQQAALLGGRLPARVDGTPGIFQYL